MVTLRNSVLLPVNITSISFVNEHGKGIRVWKFQVLFEIQMMRLGSSEEVSKPQAVAGGQYQMVLPQMQVREAYDAQRSGRDAYELVPGGPCLFTRDFQALLLLRKHFF